MTREKYRLTGARSMVSKNYTEHRKSATPAGVTLSPSLR